MKRILIVLLVLVFTLSFCSKKGGQEAEAQKQPLLVKAELMTKGTLSKYFNYKGTVSAWKTANIAPDASGRVGRILKKQGDKVGQGELLATLDMTSLELMQKQARAAMAVAQTAYQNAKLNAERMKKMLENKAISQMQYENTQLALDAADTQLKSARANLDLVDYTAKNAFMKAPFAGIIAAKNMEEGDMINPMMGMGQSILTLMDLSKVKVTVDAPAEEIEKIQIGQKCLVKISSRPDETFLGEVYSKNLAADPHLQDLQGGDQDRKPGDEDQGRRLRRYFHRVRPQGKRLSAAAFGIAGGRQGSDGQRERHGPQARRHHRREERHPL